MKKLLISAALSVVVLAVGAGIVFAAFGRIAERQSARATAKQVERVPNVKTVTIQPALVQDTRTLVGTLSPWESVTVSAEVGGKIEWKGAEQGDLVKQGKDLFRIDTEAIQTRLDQAKAHARLASQDFERVQRLTDRGVSAQRDQESAVASKDVADADVRAMEIQLRKSVAKAPFEGIIAQVFAEQDEFIDVGRPLFEVVQLHRVKLKVGIPERDVPFFKQGDAVTVQLDALPGQEFAGSIHLIAPTADPVTHTFTAEIAIDNPDGCLKPGMIARATLVRASFPDSISVPIFATALIDDQRFAMVEENGIAKLRPVEIGVIQGSNVQILSGLSAGDKLIVAGQREARPGEPVNVTETGP